MRTPGDDILIVEPAEICRPLGHERFTAPADRAILPGELLWLATGPADRPDRRYRVLIVNVACTPPPQPARFSILADPVEDTPPRRPSSRWLIGRHMMADWDPVGPSRPAGWYSITIPPDPRIHCVRNEAYHCPLQEHDPICDSVANRTSAQSSGEFWPNWRFDEAAIF